MGSESERGDSPLGDGRAGISVLMVEDSVDDAVLEAAALEQAGYRVHWHRVENDADMAQALAARSWDVVLCDHRMPGFDSFSALAVLGASGADVPLILVSGTIGEETAVAIVRAGAADFVSKDRLSRLPAVVGVHLSEARARRARAAAEHAARESDERLRRSVETLFDPFVLLRPLRDRDGAIAGFAYEYANDSACEALGIDRRELLGTPSDEHFAGLPLSALAETYESGHPLAIDDLAHANGGGGDVGQRYADVRAGKAGELLVLTWRDVTERHRAEEERGRLALIVASSHDAILSVDNDGLIVSWNHGAETVFGYAAEEVLGRSTDFLIPPDVGPESGRVREQALSGELVQRYETKRVRKDGTVIDVAITTFPLIDAAGMRYGVAAIDTDITDRKQVQRALAEAEGRYREILEMTPEGVLRLDPDGRIDLVNRRMVEMLGYSREEMIGRRLTEFMAPEWWTLAEHELEQARGRQHAGMHEQQLLRKDGESCWTRVWQAPLTDPRGRHAGVLLIASDITASRAQEEELRDTEHFLAALAESMAEGVFALDAADHVTYMNKAAEEMLGWTEEELAGLSMHDVTHYVREDGSPYPASECPMLLALSTGEIVRVDGEVFKRRDGRALPVQYSAAPIADAGSGIVVVFGDVSARRAEEQRRERERETLTWVGRIRDALDEQRLVLYAQPIVDLRTREVVTRELLVRLIDRDGTIILPGRFLPAAEQFGLIEEIDRWVIAEGVKLAQRGLKVHVNISGKSLESRALIGDLSCMVRDAGVDPALLACELTETALADDEATATAFVNALADLGCGIALDDFGMGYGGFGYLKRLPVTVLKIDMEFVRDLVGNPKNQHVVKAIVNLAQGFGRTTIAEGVESEATLALLEEYGVDSAQGFAIGRPEPIDRLLVGSSSEAS